MRPIDNKKFHTCDNNCKFDEEYHIDDGGLYCNYEECKLKEDDEDG